MSTYDVRKIIKTALNEHDGEPVPDVEAFIRSIESQLSRDIQDIPAYSHSSAPLSLVRFRCMLQDTGYPMEVYMDADSSSASASGSSSVSASASSSAGLDVGSLRERWIGWAVEIPGESPWTKPPSVPPSSSSSTKLEEATSCLSLSAAPSAPTPTPSAGPHHPSLQLKYPLAAHRASYLGALVKVYDDTAAFRPASAFEFVGIVGRAAMPASASPGEDEHDEEGEEADVMVSAIHVLLAPSEAVPAGIAAAVEQEGRDGRAEALACLTHALKGDGLAAEYLLLALLSRPSVRPTGLAPLGTLTLNLVLPSTPSSSSVSASSAPSSSSATTGSTSASALSSCLRAVLPAVVPLPLTLPLLHSTPFTPSAPTSSSLDAGLLQLAPDTLLLIDETHLGEGGRLEERAIKNLQAVQACLNEQKVGYAYPYMPDLKMECSVRGVVLSEGGRGIVRADVCLPLEIHAEAELPGRGEGGDKEWTEEALRRVRAYLYTYGRQDRAKRLVIPDNVGDVIQDAFVRMRAQAAAAKAGGATATQGVGDQEQDQDAEAALKRRMRIARLLAISHPAAELSEAVWARAVDMDEEAQRRMAQRRSKPASNGVVNGSA